MKHFRLGAGALLVCGAFYAQAAAASSCSYTNFTIGPEVIAKQGPNANGEYFYVLTALRCDASGVVIQDTSTGIYGEYELGWVKPDALMQDSVVKMFFYNMKVFVNKCSTHVLGVHQYYRGWINDVNVQSYPLQTAPFVDVFKAPVYLQYGASVPACEAPRTPPPVDKEPCLPCFINSAISSLAGNPISFDRGRKVETEQDYQNPLSSLSFRRIYNSQSALIAGQSGNGSVGARWSHNLDRRLTADSTNKRVIIERGNGAVIYFTPQNGSMTDTNWLTEADINDKLIKLTSGWQYTDASDAIELYDDKGLLQKRTERNGATLSFSYNTSNQLSGVIDQFSRKLTITYNGNGQIATLSLPDNTQISYTYDAAGNLTQVSYPDGKNRQYQYVSKTVNGKTVASLLSAIIDENGNTYASWTYDDTTGLAISSEHAGSVDHYGVAYTRDANGNVTSTVVTNPLGASQTYQFNQLLGINRPVSETYALDSSKTRTQTYDANGNVSSVTDYLGAKTSFTYDLTRNLETQRIEADGTAQARTITTEWHASFRLPTRIAEPKKRTTFTFDTLGNVLTRTEQATTDANGSLGFNTTLSGVARTWTYTYNSYGQVLTVDGPRTDVTDKSTYAYDASGNLTSITNALGHVTLLGGYDANGRVGQVTDANNLVTTYSYDARSRLTKTERYAAADVANTKTSTTYQYDGAGNLTLVTLPDLSTLTYAYDAAHRLTGIQDAQGNKITYTLDNAGNRLKEEVLDPNGVLSRRKQQLFDQLGRLQQLIGNAGQSTTNSYDANGNLTQTTDALNRISKNEYDPRNRLIKQTDPLNGVTIYGYDGLDQLVSVTDPRSLTTSYTLTGLGELTTLQNPDTGKTTYIYNPAGQVTKKTDARNKASTTTYDALGRITQIKHSDQTLTYTWDTLWKGQLSQVVDLSGTTQYGYDSLGRINSISHIPPASGTTSYPALTTQYVWNSAGQLLQQTLPSGQKLDYQYQNGKLLSISRNGQPVVDQINWHPFGGLKSYRYNGNQTVTLSQDSDGRINRIQSPVYDKTYLWDTADRITGINDTNASRNQTYDYDSLDRLTSSVWNTQNWAYSYDAVGNRLGYTLGTTTTGNSYDTVSNKLTLKGTQALTYDAAGNQLTDGKVTDTYSGAGRLASSKVGTTTTAYRYNADGARVRKGSVRYVYDLNQHLIGEYVFSTGLPQKEYIWLQDQPVGVMVY